MRRTADVLTILSTVTATSEIRREGWGWKTFDPNGERESPPAPALVGALIATVLVLGGADGSRPRTAAAAVTPGCVVDTTGLVASWTGNSTLSASIGPSLVGTATFRPGEVGNGLLLGETSDLTATSFPTVANAVTVEMWVEVGDSAFTGRSEELASRWAFPSTDDSARAFSLELDPSSNLVWSTDDTTTRRPEELHASTPLSDGALHHVAATWTAQTMSIYVDGVLAASKTSQGGVLNSASSTPFRLGSKSGLGDPFRFNGVIDEPSIWNRALTAAEIATIHTAGPSGKCNGSIARLSADGDRTCALYAAGSVKCWGFGNDGGLGNGVSLNSGVPVAVSGVTSATSLAGSASCVRLVDATVRCWGQNQAGELGIGTTSNPPGGQNVPAAPVSGITSAATVSAGIQHGCSLLLDHTIRCWGNGSWGQSGNGTFTQTQSTPVPVTGISNAISVSASFDTACAVLSDHTIRCWGRDEQGQLGNGGANQGSSIPVVVTGISNAIAVAASNFHTCALLADGTVRCWGQGGNGALGDGSQLGSSTPVQVIGIPDAIAVATDTSHSCVVRSGGTVWCFGLKGLLGVGDPANVSLPVTTPTQVTGITNAIGVALGQGHSCALLAGGGVKCWGDNFQNQLGDGTRTDSLVPVDVIGL